MLATDVCASRLRRTELVYQNVLEVELVLFQHQQILLAYEEVISTRLKFLTPTDAHQGTGQGFPHAVLQGNGSCDFAELFPSGASVLLRG